VKFRECLWIGLVAALLAHWAQQPSSPAPAPSPTPAPAPDVVAPPATPDGIPVSFDGCYAIIVEETGERPLWLRDLVASPDVRGYLNAHCAGGSKGWRQWDGDGFHLENAPPVLRELMQIPRPALPCLVIANHRKAAAIPLAKDLTPAAFIELCKPWGGP
jgi:hypothetical protein